LFDNLKVAPPLSLNKLEETTKLLRERLEYFNNLKPEDKKSEEQANPKEAGREKEQKKHSKISDCSETDFPTMG